MSCELPFPHTLYTRHISTQPCVRACVHAYVCVCACVCACGRLCACLCPCVCMCARVRCKHGSHRLTLHVMGSAPFRALWEAANTSAPSTIRLWFMALKLGIATQFRTRNTCDMC